MILLLFLVTGPLLIVLVEVSDSVGEVIESLENGSELLAVELLE
jgi:hypothetical protein